MQLWDHVSHRLLSASPHALDQLRGVKAWLQSSSQLPVTLIAARQLPCDLVTGKHQHLKVFPMHAIRQSLRPKHQVLVLKCYPKFQKNVVNVKANSSELSYLLYYASTRRSKVQKVGAFLEERTVKDVARGKTGCVEAGSDPGVCVRGRTS